MVGRLIPLNAHIAHVEEMEPSTMNELVNFARQQLGRQPAEDEKESGVMPSPGDPLKAPDWLDQWRQLAGLTHGLTAQDPRLNAIVDALADCDRHYKAEDLAAFTETAQRVRRLMAFAPGAKVRWQGSENHRLCILGPAKVEQVICSEGRLWVWVFWQGRGRWVSESIVTKIEGPTS